MSKENEGSIIFTNNVYTLNEMLIKRAKVPPKYIMVEHPSCPIVQEGQLWCPTNSLHQKKSHIKIHFVGYKLYVKYEEEANLLTFYLLAIFIVMQSKLCPWIIFKARCAPTIFFPCLAPNKSTKSRRFLIGWRASAIISRLYLTK